MSKLILSTLTSAILVHSITTKDVVDKYPEFRFALAFQHTTSLATLPREAGSGSGLRAVKLVFNYPTFASHKDTDSHTLSEVLEGMLPRTAFKLQRAGYDLPEWVEINVNGRRVYWRKAGGLALVKPALYFPTGIR